MGKLAKSISEVAGWTMASRMLGLARDILLFAALGTGALNSAFILAFTLPNLFRRLLGEGALTSSSIPILSETLAKQGKGEAFELFNAILSRLGTILLFLLILVVPLFGLVGQFGGLDQRWYIGADLSRILFPYVLFICLGALVCGLLNVLGRFGLAAFNQVWLNLSMIAALVAGIFLLPESEHGRVVLLSTGVLIGGLMQFGIPSLGLLREGWKPALNFQKHPDLDKILKLFIPGLLGAAIFQINILVSRLLAFSLDDSATGLLYIASRLVELPLGVFAIAVTTVIFPELSKMNSLGQEEGFARIFSRGLGLIFTITLPAALGLSLLAEPILGFLFQWGLFESRDVAAAIPVLIASAAGLPFFAWSTLLTRAWYSRQSMKVPVRLSMVNLILNLALGLMFMQIWGAVGLALANTISGAIHCFALQAFLPGKTISKIDGIGIIKLLLSLVLLAVITVLCSRLVGMFALPGKLSHLVTVFLAIPTAAVFYFLSLWLMKYKLVREIHRF